MFQTSILVLSLSFASAMATMAFAFPGEVGSDPWANRPNDPGYPGMWQLFSHLPPNHTGVLAETEKDISSGMHVDRAWQLHTGAPKTLIAILDSGIRWYEKDLVDQHYLNAKELPLPEGSTEYDTNHDGRFSVSDYNGDSRVSDVNQNGIIDGGDLIEIFSNHVDEDGNGYMDDIAGWDFFEGDNNPGDRPSFGHGTGEAKDSVAGLNNGIGGAGICGGCSFIALRVDDSFVVDANSFAQAVRYAVDQGASMVQQALGSYNNGPAVQAAVDYAYDQNVVIIGSAADETSFHHNFPSTLDPIVYTNAIRYDSFEFKDATTFRNFNNCSNFGARVDVSTAGRSCSSEATGNLSGITGLTLSYAKTLDRPYSTGQIISLIKNAADDINLGLNTSDPNRYSSFAGWDSISGYGRTNAYNMLTAVKNDQLPPEARIMTPRWFEVYNQASFAGLKVDFASGSQPNANQVRLDVAHGVDTYESNWFAIPLVEGSSNVTIYPETIAQVPRAANLIARDKFAFTLRLRVTDSKGHTAEARRTVYIVEDSQLKPGFPAQLSGSGEGAGYFHDLDGDGAQEYITADGSGAIHAFTSRGGEMDGFPVTGILSRHISPKSNVAVHASIFAPIAGADLDRNGGWDIVFATTEGGVGVVDQTGSIRPGFPIQLPQPDWSRVRSSAEVAQGILSAPVVADLDNDGNDQIIVAALDGAVYAFEKDGSMSPGFPVALEVEGNRAKLTSSPAIADLNSDGILDIVIGSNHVGIGAGTIFVLDGRGHNATRLFLAGFPRKIPVVKDSVLPTVGTGMPTSPLIADFNGDGSPDILMHGFLGKAYILNSNGSLQSSLTMNVPANTETLEDSMFTGFGHPSIMRQRGNQPFPVMVGVGRNMLVSLLVGGKKVSFDHLVGIWDTSTKDFIPGYPRVMEDMQLSAAFVSADFDGDGQDEIVGSSGGHFVHAFSNTGELPGFPHFTGGWVLGSPSIGDFDGDGRLDVAATTREGFLFIWTVPTTGQQSITWPNFKMNVQRTGAFILPNIRRN